MLHPNIRGQFKFVNVAWAPFLGIVLIGIVFISCNQRDRRRHWWLLPGGLLALFSVAAGCAGGGSVLPPPPQNYTVIVTGTSGAIQHTMQITVTVQ
jgi:hypothetical protein